MPSPFLASIEDQKAEIDSAGGFTLTHVDTCLSCFVLDHMNGDNELLLGVYVDGETTCMQVKADLLSEINGACGTKPGFDYDKAAQAVVEAFAAVDLDTIFAPSLEVPSEDDDEGESCYAWFRLAWPAEEEEAD